MNYQTFKNKLLNDESISFRLKDIISKLDNIDLLDAERESIILQKLFSMKVRDVLGV